MEQNVLSASAAADTSFSAFNREEVVSLAKKDLNFLASLLMPLQFTVFFPALHLVVWDLLIKKLGETELSFRTPQQKFPQIAIGWPRGHAKTTLVKLFVLWCIFFSRTKFILVVASNAAKAENIISDICDMLSEDNVLNLFGDWKIRLSTDRVNLKKFSFMGRDITIGAIGSGGDPRGLNIKNERPDLIIMDDMQSRENSESPVQSKALLSWMTSTLAKAKSPHGCMFIYIGNMFSSPGCILKTLKNNPNWLSVIVAGLLSDGSALWPELRSSEDLLQELRDDIAMGTPEAFFSEIMNDDTAGISACFDVTKVPVCPFAEDALIPASFIIIDVATDKIGADDTTIIRYSLFDGVSVAEELFAGILSPGDTIKKALVMALQHAVPVIGVESVAYQSSLLYWFAKVCEAHNIQGIQFVELFPKGRPKNSRILTMFKSLIGSQTKGLSTEEKAAPSLYLREKIKPKVFWEASQFKPNKRDNVDNILDNLAYAEDMVQDYGELLWNPLSEEAITFDNTKVLEFNTSF